MTFRMFCSVGMTAAHAAAFQLLMANASATEISSAQARMAVDNWLRRDAAPLEAKLGGSALPTTTYRDAAGHTLFHAVPIKGGGFVVTSADDGMQPIIAFSEGSSLVADACNPLWVLLNKDLSQRREALAVLRGRQAQAMPGPGAMEKEWASLLDGRQTQPLGLTSVSDLRVEPIVQSHWGQSTVSGFWGNYNCYNYYTPYGYPCGCVATAMAQIMRKHCFPTSAIPSQAYICYTDGASRSLSLLGGFYNWNDMMLLPDEGGDTAPGATIRAAIGKLCYDAGVSVHMQYSAGASGAYSSDVPGAFVNVFGYASAYFCGGWGVSEYDIRNAILCNLDHGYPVYLGIANSSAGHAVVADGYGFNGGVRYIHLNMGWNGGGNGGYQNAWYNVPLVETIPYTFTALVGIVYNIFPDKERKLVSGRVLSASGTPATNVTVMLRDLETGEIWRTLKTNNKGVYSFFWEGSENETDSSGLFAVDGLYASEESVVVADLSSGYFGVGNVWGTDLTLSKPAYYYVKLEDNGGEGGWKSIAVHLGDNPPYFWSFPSRQGYVFLGYFDTPYDGGGMQYYDANLTPVAVWHDVNVTTLYARWKAVAVQVGGVFVPYTWLDKYGIGGGYDNAAQLDQDGDGQLSWQEYVAGSEPTNRESVLRTLLTFSNGVRRVSWTPDLGAGRIYTVEGKTNLTDAVWGPTNDATRFYRVKVDLP